MYNIEELEDRLLSELKDIAEKLGIQNFKKLQKKELIYKILDQQAVMPEPQLTENKQMMTIDNTEDGSRDEKEPRKGSEREKT